MHADGMYVFWLDKQPLALQPFPLEKGYHSPFGGEDAQDFPVRIQTGSCSGLKKICASKSKTYRPHTPD